MPRHAHSCPPFRDPFEQRGYTTFEEGWREYVRWHACACAFDPAEGWHRDEHACGGFPCTSGGCYVARCHRDADCAAGVCALHASPTPSGYCATDDSF
jgi:hypothetical protein